MSTQVRQSVFETNSSSSHSLTISPDETRDMSMIADALKSGVLTVPLAGNYGWEWKFLYRPESKISYLLNQVAEDDLNTIYGSGYMDGEPEEYDGDLSDVERLRDMNFQADELIGAVEEFTGCKVELDNITSYFGVDHDSQGVGAQLINDKEGLLNFLFSNESHIRLGNDNDRMPEFVDTDLGHQAEPYKNLYRNGDVPEGTEITVIGGLYFGKISVVTPDESMYAEDSSNFGGFSYILQDKLKGFHITEVSADIIRPSNNRNYERINYDDKAVQQRLARKFLLDYLSEFNDEGAPTFLKDTKIETSVELDDEVYSAKVVFTLKGVCDPSCLSDVRAEIERIAEENREVTP